MHQCKLKARQYNVAIIRANILNMYTYSKLPNLEFIQVYQGDCTT